MASKKPSPKKNVVKPSAKPPEKRNINQTGAGPMKDSRTKRNRSRGDSTRNAIEESKKSMERSKRGYPDPGRGGAGETSN